MEADKDLEAVLQKELHAIVLVFVEFARLGEDQLVTQTAKENHKLLLPVATAVVTDPHVTAACETHHPTRDVLLRACWATRCHLNASEVTADGTQPTLRRDIEAHNYLKAWAKSEGLDE